jgi:tRNA-specific 2-thiouridylase
MSGGVDSSAAAAILLRQGYDVQGVFMDLWDCRMVSSTGQTTCCSPRDRADAKRVAEHLGIPLMVVELQAEFRRCVIEDFVQSYGQGRTPNPCVRCNEWIKFGALLRLARTDHADFLATGHYARNVRGAQDGIHRLMRGKDPNKDQSYFLFPLTQGQLARVLWPLGEWRKEDVRRQAEIWGLPVAHKAESQEVCFVPDGNYREFLETYLSEEEMAPGEIVDPNGNVLGRHKGIHSFTVGQRRGLRIPGRAPLYVLRILARERRVVVGPRGQTESRTLEADGVSWVSGSPPDDRFRAAARIRYRHRESSSRVEVLSQDRMRVTFDDPQTSITPGQAVVLYQGDEVLGGGWIRKAGP